MSTATPTPPTAADLLEAARQGDAVAFWQLAEDYRAYLKTVALNVFRGRLPSDGSEVVHDGLTIAFERLSQFQGSQPAVFLGWLAVIVRNEALRRVKDAVKIEPLPEGPEGEEVLPGSSSGPVAHARRRERAARLMAALQRLREDHRRVIELRNFQNLPFRELAQRMGRSEAAARQLWVRACKELKREFGEIS